MNIEVVPKMVCLDGHETKMNKPAAPDNICSLFEKIFLKNHNPLVSKMGLGNAFVQHCGKFTWLLV